MKKIPADSRRIARIPSWRPHRHAWVSYDGRDGTVPRASRAWLCSERGPYSVRAEATSQALSFALVPYSNHDKPVAAETRGRRAVENVLAAHHQRFNVPRISEPRSDDDCSSSLASSEIRQWTASTQRKFHLRERTGCIGNWSGSTSLGSKRGSDVRHYAAGPANSRRLSSGSLMMKFIAPHSCRCRIWWKGTPAA